MTTLAIEPPGGPPAPCRIFTALAALARARLVQFLAIGGAIFLAAPRPHDDHRIEISAEELAIVHAAQAARDGTAALDPAKAAEVTARVLEDRMLFREGVRMGLDQGDPIIEQRVVQKVLLLAESLGGATREPSAAELRAAYDRGLVRDPERYRQPPRYHVMHVFAARRDDLPTAAGLDPAALPAAGEPFPLPRETRATADELRRSYGAGFAEAVVQLAPSSGYSEPIASSFGWHRVRLVDVAPGGRLLFEAVQRQIAFDLALQRRQDAIRRFLDTTAAHYEFAAGGAPLPRFEPPMRVARHESASGED
jgi:hypothetical protein